MSQVIPMSALEPVRADAAAEPRFWSKVNKSGPASAARPDLGPCWLWQASTNGKPGYGIFRGGLGRDKYRSRRWILAHRFAFELADGPIPAGREVDHLCRNRRCVNRSHMELVTHAENTLRSDSPSACQARRDVCIRGHVFDKVEKSGKRRCSTCDRARELKRYEKRYGRKPKSRRAA